MRAAIAALIFCLVLGGCGFRLAGSERLPAVLAKPYLSVKDPYTDFSREFERELKSSGALLQLGRQDATATIEVTKDFVEQRTLAVSARNIPTDYELRYTVTFEVKGHDDQILRRRPSPSRGTTASKRTSCLPRSTKRTFCVQPWRGIWRPWPCGS